MKTIEQKALAYDEAIHRANIALDCCGPESITTKNIVHDIFPELVESEDERIRKALCKAIWNYIPYEKAQEYIAWLEKLKVLTIEEDLQGKEDVLWCIKQAKKYAKDENEMGTCWFAEQWLEKQGEKPQGKTALEAVEEEKVDNANKVELKFHKGEWLCENEPNNYARFIQILEIVNTRGKEKYKISRDLHNDEDIVECKFVEDNWHPFNIQDAKDGDVLASDNGVIILVKESRDSSWGYRLSYHCAVLYDGTFEPREFHADPEKFFPATKDQRDLLFQKMREAGYEWDAEKKELKLLITNGGDFEQENCEQKPAWSESDEEEFQIAIDTLVEAGQRDSAHWLESIKQRIGG